MHMVSSQETNHMQNGTTKQKYLLWMASSEMDNIFSTESEIKKLFTSQKPASDFSWISIQIIDIICIAAWMQTTIPDCCNLVTKKQAVHWKRRKKSIILPEPPTFHQPPASVMETIFQAVPNILQCCFLKSNGMILPDVFQVVEYLSFLFTNRRFTSNKESCKCQGKGPRGEGKLI